MGNIVVLFEVTPTKEGMERYLELAAMLKPLLAGFEGFIRAERFSSLNEDGKLLSMNVWKDEAAVERWRNMVEHRMCQQEGRERSEEHTSEHRMCQQEGREKLFKSYSITVCSAIRSYSSVDRVYAPDDSNKALLR